MLCEFKYPRVIYGKMFQKGKHEVMEKDIAKCKPYFEALVKCGDVYILAEDVKDDAPQSKVVKK